MAELATIARPYAEALFEVAANGDLSLATQQLDAVAGVAADPQLRQFADDPKAQPEQVHGVIAGVLPGPLLPHVTNLLKTVIENGRLAALPEVARQFRELASARSGIAEATIYSAFPIEPAQLTPEPARSSQVPTPIVLSRITAWPPPDMLLEMPYTWPVPAASREVMVLRAASPRTK